MHCARTRLRLPAAGAKWLVLCAKRGYRRLPPVAVRGRMACSGFDNTFLASCSRGCPFSTSRSTRLGCQLAETKTAGVLPLRGHG